MNNDQNLELRWIGKDKTVNIDNSTLLQDASLSYGDKNTENLLIHGDNLPALKVIEREYKEKIKCIYIDPPYNTGVAFEHYEDKVGHSDWLSSMKIRLEILKNLLAKDGSLWISIDDDEGHYLKVLCDEIFGRNNFVNTIIWEKKYAPQNNTKWLSDCHEFILVYAKNKNIWRPNLFPRTEQMNSRYKNPDDDPRGAWLSDNLSAMRYTANYDYPITTPSGRIVNPPPGTCWRVSKEKLENLIKDNRISFSKNGDGIPRLKRFLAEVKQGTTLTTLWKYTDVGHTQDAKREVREFNGEQVFTTPKPERLIERILTLASNENDIVLDAFLGSGTTAAVALKMNRRFVVIELGEQCYTHCIPRLKAVIDGEQGGISKSVDWQGGGGYKFLNVANLY